MIKKTAFALSCTTAIFWLTAAFAQSAPDTGNLEKLGGFKTTGTPMMEPIPQTGENIEAPKSIADQKKFRTDSR